jgi:hypothetical protein
MGILDGSDENLKLQTSLGSLLWVEMLDEIAGCVNYAIYLVRHKPSFKCDPVVTPQAAYVKLNLPTILYNCT